MDNEDSDQADLRLRMVRITEGTFPHVGVQILYSVYCTLILKS